MPNITFKDSSGKTVTKASADAIKSVTNWWGASDPAVKANVIAQYRALTSAGIQFATPTKYGVNTGKPANTPLANYAQAAPQRTVETPISATATPVTASAPAAPDPATTFGALTQMTGQKGIDDGWGGQLLVPMTYDVRGGDKRMARDGSNILEIKNADGTWSPSQESSAYYNPAGMGSNEGQQFAAAFANPNTPANAPLTAYQQLALGQGWTELPHSDGTHFSDLVEPALMTAAIAAPALLGAGGAFGSAATDAGVGSLGFPQYVPGSEEAISAAAGSSAAGSGSVLSNLASSPSPFDPTSTIPSPGQTPDPFGPNTPTPTPNLTPTPTPSPGQTNDPFGPNTPPHTDGGIPANHGTALSRLLDGTGTAADWASIAGSLAGAGLGAYGSSQQTNALKEQSDKYMAMGAPYRDKLASLYADPSKFLTSPEVQTPVQQGTNALMRSLSTSGNPWGSGNALQQGQSYASDQLFGKLGQEKDRLAGFGGLSSYNQAAPQAATNSIASNAGVYNAAGAALGNIFNPPETAAQQMTALQRALGGGR